jgi:hypothetical protein
VSNFDKDKIISFLVDSAEEYGLNLISFDEFDIENKTEIPFLEFSALKKTNLHKLKQIIKIYLDLFYSPK